MKKAVMTTLYLSLGMMAQAQTEVKGGWEQFGIANADTVIKLNRTELVAGNRAKIFYGDARQSFSASLSMCCHTLGTEQVFLCKDGRGGEMFVTRRERKCNENSVCRLCLAGKRHKKRLNHYVNQPCPVCRFNLHCL